MIALFKKEISSFFASPIGYLVIAVFLILNGLFLWVFEGNFNILDSGFADLLPFFQLTPWIFIFLIPAITMKSFSEEKKMGTLELLFTKPISLWSMVIGKYVAALFLTILALIPTILYVWTVWQLGNPAGNLDIGSTLGSYIGLLFLAMSYTAIGIFASTLSTNQIVAFMLAVLFSFFLYYGIDEVIQLLFNTETTWSLKAHFDSIGRGVIDTRDLIYFISMAVFFLYLTVLSLKRN
ncbi:gliding motility-associated ABC transporter permease subunit GldF [Imtechella halotolerans]|uniref:Gliding motility-associated ABC transporter permease GldF n=1 Tax=Imtechella halotolerans K1 TaxID=946077 RepID=I0WF88_9FLAO|nr:gliding motility-associated ABC transporter permease subunit GldF [Imtechella halotolerans]EID75054.1 gliding motility-associated ABC transporter permease GldF [Imtechella halotolerans K1]WMQ63824.1 gliding motility-associated ABC transporter permease subunit GldF [Imtechella halotolerans]